MEKLDKDIKAHMFICTRHRDRKACCASRGAEALADNVKAWLKDEGLKDCIKVSRSSCLGHCKTGITAVIYPQNQWLHQLTEDDLPDIKKMLKEYA